MLEYGCRLERLRLQPSVRPTPALVSHRRVNSSLLQHSSSAGSLSAPGFSISFSLSRPGAARGGEDDGVIVSSCTYARALGARGGGVHVERLRRASPPAGLAAKNNVRRPKETEESEEEGGVGGLAERRNNLMADQ